MREKVVAFEIAYMLTNSDRYLSQVRQELAVRLLARLYADGPTPSKVRLQTYFLCVDGLTVIVVAQLHKEEIHG